MEREASAAGCPKWSEKESGGPGAFAEVDFGACISIAFRDTMRLARVESAYQEVEVRPLLRPSSGAPPPPPPPLRHKRWVG